MKDTTSCDDVFNVLNAWLFYVNLAHYKVKYWSIIPFDFAHSLKHKNYLLWGEGAATVLERENKRKPGLPPGQGTFKKLKKTTSF